MKKDLGGLLVFVVFVLLCTSSLFEELAKLLVWLVTLNMTQSTISSVGEIFVKVATFAITYAVVGIIFKTIGWFNSNVMKFVYFVLSTLISFALCYVVMIFEKYLLLFAIAFGVIILVITVLFVINYIHKDNHRDTQL